MNNKITSENLLCAIIKEGTLSLENLALGKKLFERFEFRDACREMAIEGDKVAAIKRYMHENGCGLRISKMVIDGDLDDC